MRICPRTGEVRWSIDAHDSVRSDSHQVVVRASHGQFVVQGSPARCMGDGDTVFGAGDAGRDVWACARAMVDFAARHVCVDPVPHLRLWRVSRVDVTGNFSVGGLPEVRVALSEFRNIEGGRYRVSQQAGDTVYWSHLSRHRAGKAYAKGPQLQYLMGKQDYSGRVYSEDEMKLASSLLRLELRLGGLFFSRMRKLGLCWYNMSWDFFEREFSDYFDRMVGNVEIDEMSSILDELKKLYDEKKGRNLTDQQALAVYRTWSVINLSGWQFAKDSMPKATWYLHLSYLRKIGLGDADISAGRIVSLRRQVVMRPVSSWEDLRRAA